jgi:hypothetical protein
MRQLYTGLSFVKVAGKCRNSIWLRERKCRNYIWTREHKTNVATTNNEIL